MRGKLRRLVPTALALVLAGAVGLPLLAKHVATSRLRRAADARGLAVGWSRATLALPIRIRFQDLLLIQTATGDTVFRADSLGVALDPWALLLLRPRIASVGVSHAAIRLWGQTAADPDTVAPQPTKRDRREDPVGAARLRRSAEALVRLAAAPARRLPRLTLRDVSISAPRGGDALWSGAQIARLDLEPAAQGMQLRAAGAIQGERELPFEAWLLYARDDRLVGGARVGIPEGPPRAPIENQAGSEPARIRDLRLTVDGALTQDRRAGVVTLHDSTRVWIGEIPLTVGARLERRGPRVRVRLAGDGFTEERIRRSLPEAVLGQLLDIGVRGRWDYRLAFDLDLARPDSVSFTADVIPRGLALDPQRSRLRLLGLDQPFVATIHLPRDRIATRELSTANPNFRPLAAIAPALVYAVVTNEDGGFFRHRGFNTEAVKDAIAENLKAGAFRRGAGTITMQLARNLYLGHERTLSRKFREVVLAWVLEHLAGISKERLLEIYLNIIEWGPGVHGAGEAARYYFDRDPGDLTVDEALFLATVVPAPTKWRYRFDAAGGLHPFERAQMHFIGRAMIAKGWLGPEQLPPADSLRVELRGPARAALLPDSLQPAPRP